MVRVMQWTAPDQKEISVESIQMCSWSGITASQVACAASRLHDQSLYVVAGHRLRPLMNVELMYVKGMAPELVFL